MLNIFRYATATILSPVLTCVCVCHSLSLSFYSIFFLPIHRLIKPKITIKFSCTFSLFLMFLPLLKFPPFSEKERNHIITCAVERKFLEADFNGIYINRVYTKGRHPNRGKGNKNINITTAINPLNTKRRLLYLKTQFVPCSKHFSCRL